MSRNEPGRFEAPYSTSGRLRSTLMFAAWTGVTNPEPQRLVTVI
jgi:hypothetical protein